MFTLPSGGFFFQISGHNLNLLQSIDIIALTQDFCVMVLGGVVWGKCGYVMEENLVTLL